MDTRKIIGMTFVLSVSAATVTHSTVYAAAQLDAGKVHAVFDSIAKYGARVTQAHVLFHFIKIANVALKHSELIIQEARRYFSEDLHEYVDAVEEAFHQHKGNVNELRSKVVPHVAELFRAHARSSRS